MPTHAGEAMRLLDMLLLLLLLGVLLLLLALQAS
jgi:competence protein ComGC